MKWIPTSLLALLVAPAASLAQAPSPSPSGAPVFAVLPTGSSIAFAVTKASVPIQGRFDKWKGSLTFTSPEVSTGVLQVSVDADSVDTGSDMKNGKLKSAEFFDVKNYPVISFRSTNVAQTGPQTFSVTGDFTIRGVSKPQTVALKTTGRGAERGEIKGTMTFDRKDYGMNGGSGIPFVSIGDHVDVTIDLKVRRVSGPPVRLQS